MTGLRERKKLATRQHLAHVATLMFIEHGFDRVTIAEIAEAAGVSKMTVTNYFPLKEDLVFDAHAGVVDSLAALVRTRPEGQSVVDALLAGFLTSLKARTVVSGYATPGFARLVRESDRLRAREREIDELREEALAAELADEVAAPRFVAAVIAGVYRTLFRLTREHILAGLEWDEVCERMTEAATAGFDLIRPVVAA
ncbi:TetR/AcrR family transcriptional regulator [Kutzneria kofuensis]|uniref:AcrR family transcriptional regulator n=1 Tax=Kutzneria kofuensis TaxID=103725 RepID=A0A7W9KCU7_9PSEU|nr:TetR/AcrR family transcriptional regulator [Kutzneria kofuensis]MBB5890249.1 AcrR family transcriptional regulator [Kutzneria kofuensis]